MTYPGKKITFFYPSLKKIETLPFSPGNTCGTQAVSITGSQCRLNCKHCGGLILQHMQDGHTPKALKETAFRLAEKGGRTLLISGGADAQGQVPLFKFFRTINEIRSELGLRILVHTGLVSSQLADGLAEAGIDLAMLDIIGDLETIRQVYHLKAAVEDYEKSLKILTERGIPTAPHVVMGLHFGQIRGEPLALQMISRYPIQTLVLVGFRPIPKTAMSSNSPPSPEALGKLFNLARSLFPQTRVVLGCERPLGLHRRKTDLLAVQAGLDGITYPSEQTVQWAEEQGFVIQYLTECCALIEK